MVFQNVLNFICTEETGVVGIGDVPEEAGGACGGLDIKRGNAGAEGLGDDDVVDGAGNRPGKPVGKSAEYFAHAFHFLTVCNSRSGPP